MRFEIVRPHLEDAEEILAWRSDPDVMKNSLTFTKILPLEIFFPSFLATHFTIPALPPLYILEECKRVGLLRFNLAPGQDAVEISIVLCKEARGRGLGKAAIKSAADFVKEQGFTALLAQVKTDNIASLCAFEAAGFRKEGEAEGFYQLVLPLKAPESRKVFIIAEVGSNWTSADPYELIKKAHEAGADAVKFQVFRAETTYVANAGESGYLKGEINEIFKSLEMPYDMIPKLAEACQKNHIEFMATPFSVADFKALDPFVKRHKIASYENNHLPLLKIAAESGKPLIVSTGATKEKEVRWTYDTLKLYGAEDITLLQCVAKYPAPPEQMNVEVIRGFKEEFRCPVGLSDHTLDPYAAPLAAVALGATVIEKHYTLDRGLPGPDHSFAITPDELKQLVSQIRLVEKMRGTAYKQIEPCENELRAFARRGLQAITSIAKGDIFKEGINVAILRPGTNMRGASPDKMENLEGTVAARSYKLGEGIYLHD